MTVQSIRGVVETAIQRASSATGVDFSFLMKTAKRESGYNPTAKAGTSSAAGLFQFVDQTWLSTLKKHGSKYGYARYADLISQDNSGRFHVAGGGEARKAVMGLKLDPHAASLMAGELASDHASYLRGRTGRTPTSGELYAAHFLGPKGSAKLIEAMDSRPEASAAALFPEAAQANRSIFYRNGRAATVGEVYANLTRTGGPEQALGEREPTGFIQYASARRDDRVQQQQALVEFILRGSQKSNDPFDLAMGDQGSTRGLGGSLFTSEMLRVLAEANKTKT
ncbi:transglycosylase SLT domain-containing protein [Caulobacter segnis]|uniref:transglycosylase SLT domain-containing protein n=1 Tax=Caulobacter segnis TaxID=88688 RepID=UPI00240F36AD|nr:transglycosylase SLT domain-containing protein [Caulobacter segnis]MDG2522862.1 transglycosylase SLT domain-containing protein [Caulobacter segnis]